MTSVHTQPDPARVRQAVRAGRGTRVAVVGAGRSGLAAAAVLAARGAKVVVLDDRDDEALVAAHGRCRELEIECRGGGIDADRLLRSDAVVVSPGVPLTHPALQRAVVSEKLLLSEIDVGLALLDLPLIAVTGTNGKSTTTTMLGSLLQAGGARPFVGGNLGRPLCEAVGGSWDSLVVELSSYQLELASLLRPRVAVVTNLAPDHLDRYPDVNAYYEAKRQIFRRLAPGGCVVARSQEVTAGLLHPASGQRWLLFGATSTGPGARIVDDAIEICLEGLELRLAPANPRIRGAHNLENLAAATLAAVAFGVDPESLTAGVKAYPGIAHRLEDVATVNGVLYVNDSKATNVAAAVKALESFTQPVLLIAGGRDKGTGYTELVSAARDRVRTLLAIGEAAGAIAEAVRPVVPEVVMAGTVEHAVVEASRRARAGEVVLLAPACASFDQFANFEQRGLRFVELVRELEEGRA